MANQITGKVLQVGTIQPIPTKGGKSLQKREITLDCTRYDPYTGERSTFENTPLLEFAGEAVRQLDGIQQGEVVTISFDVQGTKYTDQQGATKIFTRLRPYKIERRNQQASAPVPPPPQYDAPAPSLFPPPQAESTLPF